MSNEFNVILMIFKMFKIFDFSFLFVEHFYFSFCDHDFQLKTTNLEANEFGILN